jgi:hypothetical protein
MSSNIEYIDRPAPRWFPLTVMRAKGRERDWVALMVDVDPADLKKCRCDFQALFYVDPKSYRPGDRVAQQRWLRIEGKHKSLAAASDALERMMATRN